MINWLLARQNGWHIALRIEDLDGPRVKAGADEALLDDLQWLGIDWDSGPIYQSSRSDFYRAAVERLIAQSDAYPCVCTRREIETAASAPHADDGAAVYPGTCRGRFASVEEARRASGREPAIRFRVPATAMDIDDDFAGRQHWDNLEKQLGDFVILKNDGLAAYQLAVVIDDADARVTHVVRGDDLIDSTPRQVLLYRALGLADRVPRYIHLPLVVGPDGRRLAKRHGDTRLSAFRAKDPSPAPVLRLLSDWCGLDPALDVAKPANLVALFDLSRVPRSRVVYAP